MSQRAYGYWLAAFCSGIPLLLGVGGVASGIWQGRVWPIIIGTLLLGVGWQMWVSITRIADQIGKNEKKVGDVVVTKDWSGNKKKKSSGSKKKKPKPIEWQGADHKPSTTSKDILF